jgi:predicted AlkP superfamily phosphohydrolase/phosphomutase
MTDTCSPTATPKGKVVLIGIDGTHVPTLNKMMDNGELPTLQSFQTKDIHAAWTLDAMTVYPPISGAAWTSCFYSQPPQYLGGAFFDNLKGWIDPNSGYLNKENYSSKHSLFEILDGQNLKSIAIGGWTRMCDFVEFGKQGCSLDSSPPESDRNWFNVVIDEIRESLHMSPLQRVSQDRDFAELTIKALNNNYDFIFTHFRYSDNIGHEHGTDSMYRQVLRDTDTSIKLIMDKLDFNHDHIIIMSDHGRNPGSNHRHHDEFLSEAMTTPFFIKGPMVNPGTLTHPVSILDVTPTILNILGVDTQEYALEFFGRDLL